MSVSDIQEAIKWIEYVEKQYYRYDKYSFFRGEIDAASINKAEYILGLKFPADYRYFLEHLGAGRFYELPFYGIENEYGMDDNAYDVIELTLKNRQDRYMLLPNYFLSVYNCIGGYYVIDCRDSENTPLYIWDRGYHKEGDELEKKADSFGAFLKKKFGIWSLI